MRNVVLHSDSSFKRQPLENLFLFCKREFCSFFCLTMQHHSNWSKERSVIDYPSHAIKKRTITKEQLQNERTNKRSKEKRKKQTNKQTNFNSRKTKRDQAVISWRRNTPEGVVWGNLKKKEDQEELVGDGTDIQTFLIYLHPPSRFWDESWHFVLFACGLLLFLVRYSCCRAGRRSPVEQHPSVTVSL